jgi:uncharacterized protein (DUF58 family)
LGVTIDPAFLDELDRFEVARDRGTDDRRQGQQESPDVGEGLTFADYRRYVPGDDVRLVDWKVYARTGEVYIKQYEAERNLTVHVLIDASASMGFGEGQANKFEFGAKIGLGFAHLLQEEGNDIRVSTFREIHDRLDTGRSSRGELLRVIETLNETTPEGIADHEAALGAYAGTIDSRSLVVVASDFLADPDGVEAGLSALARGGNDLVCAHVVAPDELDPPTRGDTVFEDPESRETRRTYFGERVARRYRQRLDDHVAEIRERAERLRASHALVDTGEEFFDAFARLWVG